MRILVIEDNLKMASAIQRGLEEHNLAVDVCHEGGAGEELAASQPYDVVVLDWMLPDRDGLEVCRNLRQRKVAVPVLMLTALSDTAHTVRGLEAGADDYLAKPFEFAELVARVRALMRRHEPTLPNRLVYEDVTLDLDRFAVERAGNKIRLSAKELALLEYMLRNPDRVLRRSLILEKVWDMQDMPTSNVVDVYVSNLRRKLDRGFERPLLHTVVGIGYRFGCPDA